MPAETGRIAWHVITAELHTGMLTLAFASLVIRLAGVWVTTSNGVWRGLVRLADPTAFLAAIGGLLALIASIVTGLLYTWPVEVLLTSSVVLNKIATTAFATTFWTLFIVVRAFSGARLWDRARLRWLYFVLGTGGVLSLMLVGSTGGPLAGERGGGARGPRAAGRPTGRASDPRPPPRLARRRASATAPDPRAAPQRTPGPR